MQFTSPLIKGSLVKRYKRFLADVTLADGREVTAHCANTGRMTGCAEPSWQVWLSESDNPKRKLKYSWELSRSAAGDFIGIRSALANDLVFEAINDGVITELSAYDQVKREVTLGDSRIDFCLAKADNGKGINNQKCFVEVKSVTLLAEKLGEKKLGLFPDTVSERASKHVHELISARQQGHRAVLLFCAQHTGIERVAPANSIDEAYGEAIADAVAAGVELLAYGCEVTPTGIVINRALPCFTAESEVPKL